LRKVFCHRHEILQHVRGADHGMTLRRLQRRTMVYRALAGLCASLIQIILLTQSMRAQQDFPSPSACPVLATLASSKIRSTDANDKGEYIVIWFWNQGQKTSHGVEFRLSMLDTAGNKYPASQAYQEKGDVKPRNGDLVTYPTNRRATVFR
jgi:hypothetical protein